jgi:hypothetical protein
MANGTDSFFGAGQSGGYGGSGYVPILSDIFGQKPAVIPWINVLLGGPHGAQAQALLSNIENFANIEKLGNLWQHYMLGGLENAVPGFGQLLGGIVGGVGKEIETAKNFLAGILPEDVVQHTYASGAMQNLLSGVMGAPMGVANLARNLGLTSLDLIGQGANLLGNASQRWGQLAGFAQGTMAPIQNMLITPQEQYTANLTNEINKQRTEQSAANVRAAPNPIAKGLSDLVAYLTASYIGHGSAGQPPQAPGYASDIQQGQMPFYGEGTPTSQALGPALESAFPGTDAYGNPAAAPVVPGSVNDQMALPTASSGAFGAPPPSSQLYGTDIYGGTAFSGAI